MDGNRILASEVGHTRHGPNKLSPRYRVVMLATFRLVGKFLELTRPVIITNNLDTGDQRGTLSKTPNLAHPNYP